MLIVGFIVVLSYIPLLGFTMSVTPDALLLLSFPSFPSFFVSIILHSLVILCLPGPHKQK